MMRMLVTLPLPAEVRALIVARCDVIFDDAASVMSGEEIVAASLRHAPDAILVSGVQAIDARLIERLPASVRTIATYSVGYDHVALPAAAARGIDVIHTPDVLTDAVAEVAILLMLGAARRATESIELLRSGEWRGWTPTQLLGIEVTGLRMGIFGMGRIGQRIAERARGFEMEIHYRAPRPLAPERAGNARHHADDESFLAASDVLMLAPRVTPDTVHYLNAERIARLPRTAIVVNIARGAIVDDGALIGALAAGRIAGAGLDVFENEPAIDPRYRALPNAFLLPHIGSSTRRARIRMAVSLLDALDLLAKGARPATLLSAASTSPSATPVTSSNCMNARP